MNELSKAAAPRLAPERPSRIADKYRVVRALGRGATAEVYLCEHVMLGTEVAVKVLLREHADDAELVARFHKEARIAARLAHPNVVHVQDCGRDLDRTSYIAMEYVAGQDLGAWLRAAGPLPDAEIVDIMQQVLAALSAAHALGIVHRDVKPENILVQSAARSSAAGRVKLCDFGIAFGDERSADASVAATVRLTCEGMMVGTPAYMSPEQACGLEVDARSDVYSAGVVLFQLLTRRLPFAPPTPLSAAVMHCTAAPPRPSSYASVHRGLEAVCLKALHKEPGRRYASAAAMASALEAALRMRAAGSRAARTQASARAGKVPRLAQDDRSLAGGALRLDAALIVATTSRLLAHASWPRFVRKACATLRDKASVVRVPSFVARVAQPVRVPRTAAATSAPLRRRRRPPRARVG